MIKIFINDEEVLCDKNFTIKEEMQNTSSVILNNVYPKTWENDKDYVSRYYYPEDYSKCTIYNDDKLIFTGVVQNTGNISLNPRYPHYCNLQVLGFETFLSEGQTLDYVIYNENSKQAIQEVIKNINDYGFVEGNLEINDDTVIGAYSTQDKTAYDMFNYLAEITRTKWYTKIENENSVSINFKDYNKDNKGEMTLDYTNNFFKKNNIIDISFSYSSNDYRNRQVVLSDSVFGGSEQKEVLYSNGYGNIYSTEYIIGKIESIEINGQPAEFTTSSLKELGVKADVYYTPYKSTIETNDILDAGSTITITYLSIINGREVINDNSQIERITNSINRKGVVSRYEKRNDTQTSDELYKIAQSYMKYKGSPEINLKVKNENKKIYNIGDVVYFENAPIDSLKTNYLVKSIEVNYIATTNEIIYTYNLVSSYNTENAINYFDNQRSKNRGNLEEGTFVNRNLDIPSEATIYWDDLTCVEVK